MPISNYAEAKILDAVYNGVAYSVATTFLKLHIGNPGEDCIAFPAAHVTRQQISWGAAVAGLILNDQAVTFTPLTASETISHVSVWDALTVGNPLWYGPMGSPQAVNAGGILNFAIGALIVTLD